MDGRGLISTVSLRKFDTHFCRFQITTIFQLRVNLTSVVALEHPKWGYILRKTRFCQYFLHKTSTAKKIK